ncbi:MAG TPA: tetratricopeptide repeat protein [Anaerolineae bacterium]|nr:tetratricopeptide repeat protein [Anaerolineae bacterium]
MLVLNIRRILTRAVLLGLLFLNAACTGTPSPTQVLKTAEARVVAGEYTAAESLYRQVAAQTPDDPAPMLQLAELYLQWGQPQAGLAALTTAQQRGYAGEILPLRLSLLIQAQNWTQARILAQGYLQTHPDDVPTLAQVTTARLWLGDCAAAAESAARWYSAVPTDTRAALTYGALTGDAARLCQGSADFCAPCAPACDLQHGYRLLRDENWPLAACVLERAVAADPTSADAHAWLGEALTRTDRPALAQPHFEQATALAPEAPLGWLLLGLHRLRQGDAAAARESLLEAQRLDPDNPAPCLALAEVKALSGDYEEIATWTEAALERAPNDAEVWKAVARFYLTRNLLGETYPLYAAQGAVQLAPNDAEAAMLLGWTYLAQDAPTRALTELDRAIQLDPMLGQAHYLRGLALQATGDPAAAQSAFTRAADWGYRP